MNRKKILYIAALAVGLLSASCNDQFLEDKKLYGVFDENTFQNETQTGWFIDKVYYDYYYGYKSPGLNIVGLWEDRTGLTEEKGGMSNLLNPTKSLETSDDCSQYYGAKLGTSATNSPYTRIRNCNFVINNIDELGTNVSATFKTTAKGQMYFLRAIQYFDLVRMYGGVPIVTTVSKATSEDESIKYPRRSVTDCVDQIISDLDSAATKLPNQWNAANYGRFTRAAALAMKSRVLLTYASPLYNKDWDNPANDRWAKALEAGLTAEKELTTAGYGLYGSSAKDWSNMFLVDNTFCKEAIMVKLLSPNTTVAENNSWEKTIRLSNQGGSGGLKAPKEMIDLFPMADGSRPTVANGYNDFKFFLNRDPRFYRTFAFSGCKWGYKSNPTATVWGYRWQYTASGKTAFGYSDNNDVNSPAFVRKMTNTAMDNVFDYSGTDIFEYRYAELLLNIAECYAATNNVTKCLEYLSLIRKRVGIPSANNYGIGTLADKYAAIEACLYERRVELAYEGKRTMDIQRWMLYNDDASANNTTCAKLGISPINGTSRTGHYLEYKTTLTSNTDPLASARSTISVDPDATPAVFAQSLQDLATFYEQNFVLKDPATPMDNDGLGKALKIGWKQRYYIWGIHRTALTANSWLEQTIGWLDANNAQGTFDYQK
ncbi:RagB/SusD family nutrient uptake outer membrane protein [uncultured Bacteroides sp.]|uniref:RagB/SusD family nutrient uptake outer membrane protein n=1 Tax=uncultured Bacteroides sp. TaxID=162156 RepID=UPI002AA6AC35|nr:RagB/SusD family nutrient uptake outer membrane protein [uncultured Bacteroides sp.]